MFDSFPCHYTLLDNNGLGVSNWVNFKSIQYIVKTLHSLDCYRWSLQKQVGCFNYKVVTLVAYKLERQWWYERYRRQKYFQSNPRGCCSCSSSYHQNTLKPLKTYAKIYYKCTIQNCSMELSCSWGKQLGDSLPDVLTIFMQCIRWTGQQTSLSHHFYATVLGTTVLFCRLVCDYYSTCRQNSFFILLVMCKRIVVANITRYRLILDGCCLTCRLKMHC